MSMAIDRNAIVDEVMEGLAVAANQIVAEGFGGFSSTWSFGDTSSTAVGRLDELVSHTYATAGSFSATLTAVSPLAWGVITEPWMLTVPSLLAA